MGDTSSFWEKNKLLILMNAVNIEVIITVSNADEFQTFLQFYG